MKRSEINKALKELEAMLADYRLLCSEICRFYTGGMGKRRDMSLTRSVIICLGWDITDYGMGDLFDKIGFSPVYNPQTEM